MIREIIAQLGKIAVTSLKLGREVAKEKAVETVDALKEGKAAHWLNDTLVRLGLRQPEAKPATKPASAKRRTGKPGIAAAALPKKAGLNGRHATAHH